MNEYWTPVNDTRLYGLKELSGLIGINYHTLRNAVRDGRVAAIRSGGIWLSSQAAIAHAIKAGKIRGNRRERDG